MAQGAAGSRKKRTGGTSLLATDHITGSCPRRRHRLRIGRRLNNKAAAVTSARGLRQASKVPVVLDHQGGNGLRAKRAKSRCLVMLPPLLVCSQGLCSVGCSAVSKRRLSVGISREQVRGRAYCGGTTGRREVDERRQSPTPMARHFNFSLSVSPPPGKKHVPQKLLYSHLVRVVEVCRFACLPQNLCS